MKINFKNLLIIFLISMLGAGIGTFGVNEYYHKNISAKNTNDFNTATINKVEYSNIKDTDYTNAIEKAFNTVVEVSATVKTSNPYFFYGQSETAISSGSGVIISSDGYIVTNYHVIEGANDDSVSVKLYNSDIYEAKIIGFDSRTDLAVLKIEENNLPYSEFVDSSTLKMGQDAIAIGNPLGLGISCSNGIVSALEKQIYSNNVYMNVIQTNAAVNSGNSGGGLFDINGNLIGIVNAKNSKSTLNGSTIEGMGYAIPSNTVIKIVEEIIENGYVKNRAALGVKVVSSRYYSKIEGVLVSEVFEGSAANKAGIKENDIIIGINDTKISSYADLSKALDSYNVDDVVTIKILRDSKEIDLKVTLQNSAQN